MDIWARLNTPKARFVFRNLIGCVATALAYITLSSTIRTGATGSPLYWATLSAVVVAVAMAWVIMYQAYREISRKRKEVSL